MVTRTQCTVCNVSIRLEEGTAGGNDGELWKITAWEPGTAHKFGEEAVSSLAAALGSPGIQLTVLTLGHVDLGDAGMQLLSRGLGRCHFV